jgi:hypothetical protein
MRRLIRLAITIALIVLCFRCVRNCGSEAVAVAVEMVPDKEVVMEKSDDPYDVLYGVNQEEGTYSFAAKFWGGVSTIQSSYNEHFNTK